MLIKFNINDAMFGNITVCFCQAFSNFFVQFINNYANNTDN